MEVVELSKFRQRLQTGELNLEEKELLQKEYDYFASIAPPPSRIDMWDVLRTLLVVLLFLLCPVVFIFYFYFWKPKRTSKYPEHFVYDFKDKIAEPTLRLFDKNLAMRLYSDLLKYTPDMCAFLLEKDYLVRPHPPQTDITHAHVFSCCSYDWENWSNTDAFEFLGIEIRHEWSVEDDNGNSSTCEEVGFRGSVYTFHTSFTIKGTINIMSTSTKKTILGIEKEKNSFKPSKSKKAAIIDTENHEFNANFDVLATCDEEAYRYLTPAMMETLLALRKECFFAIFIDRNVMTVTVDNGGFRAAKLSAFNAEKPVYAPANTAGELNRLITRYREALLSIYELKDALDPAGKYSMY